MTWVVLNAASVAPYFSIAKDWIVAGVSVAGVCVAVKGLSTWNRQLKGGFEYELSRRLLKSVYQLREEFKVVRSPIMMGDEMEVAEADAEGKSREKVRHIGTANAYKARWKGITTIGVALKTDLFDAEATWGVDAIKAFEPLHKLQRELFFKIFNYLASTDPELVEAARDVYRKKFREARDILYDLSLGEEEGNDEYGNDVIAAIKKIEEFLQEKRKKLL